MAFLSSAATMRPQLSTTTSKPPRRALRRRAAKRPHPPITNAAAAPAQAVEPRVAMQRRIREAGGPEDHALYTCSCGYAFEADVSTGVACPNCGVEQSW
jgi:rubrerythrin